MPVKRLSAMSEFDDVYDLLFNDARTYNTWSDKTVEDSLLQQAYDLAKMGPTAANCLPMRIVFVKSDEAKARLKPLLSEGNVEQTMAAPVTAIIAFDTEFYEHLPELFPHTDAKSWYVGNDNLIQETAFRNGSMQGGDFILAARALGLDCGPMSGFDTDKLNAEFFPDGRFKANFLCNLGYGTEEGLYPRSPRLGFDQACEVL